MGFFKPKVPEVQKPPNAPRQADASVIGGTLRNRAGDLGTSSLIGTSATGLKSRAATTKRQTFGGS